MKQFWLTNLLDDASEILIYGYIGEEEVNAGDFVRELRKLEAANKTINIRINSGGGSVFEGLAIFNAIQQCKADTHAYIDGLCASMATAIALACKKVSMSKSAMFMTHRASGFAGGNAKDLKAYAAMMEQMENVICSIYATKTGLSLEDARKKYMGDEDNWISADQALKEKLIDSIYDGPENVTVPQLREQKQLVGFYNSVLKTNLDMKSPILSADMQKALNLTDASDQNAFNLSLTALIEKAKKTDELEMKVTQLTAELNTAKTQGNKDKVLELLNTALNTDKKITKATSDKLAAQFEGKPDELKALLDTMSPIVSLTEAINNGEQKNKDFAAKTWEELDNSGLLEDFKKADFEGFKAKFKQEFKREYTGDEPAK